MPRPISRASILLVLVALGAGLVVSLVAQATVARVLFRDGGEIVVENPSFRYEYGVSQTPDLPSGFTVYAKQTKRSPDLHLERVVVERGVTSRTPVTIRAADLGCIVYRWVPSKTYNSDGKGGQIVTPSEVLSEIVIELRSGMPMTLTPATLNVSDAFLTDSGYPFSESVALVGQAKTGAGKPNEFTWVISFGFLSAKKEQVDRICFSQ